MTALANALIGYSADIATLCPGVQREWQIDVSFSPSRTRYGFWQWILTCGSNSYSLRDARCLLYKAQILALMSAPCFGVYNAGSR